MDCRRRIRDRLGGAILSDARPVHRVAVDGFWMDGTEVTNAQFAEFVQATGYVTVAERVPRAEDYPGARPEKLVADSVVFTPPIRGATRQSFPLVELRHRRRLATSRGSPQLDRQTHGSPRRPHRLGGRAGLCEVGRQAAAHRSGVGVRRTRRPRPQEIRVGRQLPSGRQGHGQHLPGPFPGPEHERGRLPGHFAGESVPSERVRALRHGG